MEENNNVQTKTCKCCGRELPITEFNKRTANEDGLDVYCRDCTRKKCREYYARTKQNRGG